MSELDKLRWRCRRGTLELDMMLNRYLDYCYSDAGDQERQAFADLLALEDNTLLEYLLGERMVQEAGLAAIVTIIRQLRGRY